MMGSSAVKKATEIIRVRVWTAMKSAACHPTSAKRFNARTALREGATTWNSSNAKASCNVPCAEGLTSVRHRPTQKLCARANSNPV